MSDDRSDVGGTDGDARLRRYIRAGSALVMGVSVVAMVFIPSLRGSEITIGMFVGGLLLLGGVSAHDIPWFGGRK